MVFDKGFGRGSTKVEDYHVLEIAQETGKYPSAGEIDITGAHAFDYFGRHGVHDVANQSDGGDDRCGLVDEGFVVASY